MKKFHLADAHRITKGDNVVIAVIDSEIDSNQPDLAGRVIDRYDAGCGAILPRCAWHRHGRRDRVPRTSARHRPERQHHRDLRLWRHRPAQATSIKIINGLDYAIQHGARIVNMSFAGPHDPALSQELQIAREKGILVIAAAGNEGPKSPPLYPGADRSVMAVTATDEHDRLFNGANQGKYVTVAAPGVDILVPAPDGEVQFTTGTSVATANVSGVAALLLPTNHRSSPEEIRAILVRTARHLGPEGINPQFGAGLVDPLKALEFLVSEKPPEQESVRRFLASLDASSERIDDGFSALSYAGNDRTATKALASRRTAAQLARLDRRSRHRFQPQHVRQRSQRCAGQRHRRAHAQVYAELSGRRARRLRALRL